MEILIKKLNFIFFLWICLLGCCGFAASDTLGEGIVRFSAVEPRKFIEEKLQNPKEILNYYNVVLDRGTKIISPLTLAGTTTNPVLKVSIEKCVFIICQKADLDTEFSVQINTMFSKNCELNVDLVGDLSRSSPVIIELYSQMRISVCFVSPSNSDGELRISGQVVRAPTYSSGIVQSQIFQLLKMQFPAILEAARKSVGGRTFPVIDLRGVEAVPNKSSLEIPRGEF